VIMNEKCFEFPNRYFLFYWWKVLLPSYLLVYILSICKSNLISIKSIGFLFFPQWALSSLFFFWKNDYMFYSFILRLTIQFLINLFHCWMSFVAEFHVGIFFICFKHILFIHLWMGLIIKWTSSDKFTSSKQNDWISTLISLI
jgi:hypothetical protein